MPKVFGNSSATFNYNSPTEFLPPPPPAPPPTTNPQVLVSNISSVPGGLAITFSFPEALPTDKEILDVSAVFCDSAANIFAGADAVIGNPSFPKVACPIPVTRSVYSQVTVIAPSALFVPNKNYTVLTVMTL